MATSWPTPGVTPSPWGQQLIDAVESRDTDTLDAAKAHADAHANKASGAHPATAISYAGGRSLPAGTVEAALDALGSRSGGEWTGTTDLNALVNPGTFGTGVTAPNAPVAATCLVTVTVEGNNVVQRAVGVSTPRGFVRSSWDKGATWLPWRPEGTLGEPIAGGMLVGAGSPEGGVTAPVGCRYTDTAYTNGARVWRKDSNGSGNTGWQVAEADTGWRNIAASLLNGWTASLIRLRRTDSAVMLAFDSLNPAARTSSVFCTLPAGFGTGTLPWPSYTLVSSTGVLRRVGVGPDVSIGSSTTGDGLFNAYLMWQPTPAIAWPTTLPGTAA